jgi:hypothetical protein
VCANRTGRAEEFLSASGPSLSQEVADGKVSVQSACTLRNVYICTTPLSTSRSFSLCAYSNSPVAVLISMIFDRAGLFEGLGSHFNFRIQVLTKRMIWFGTLTKAKHFVVNYQRLFYYVQNVHKYNIICIYLNEFRYGNHMSLCNHKLPLTFTPSARKNYQRVRTGKYQLQLGRAIAHYVSFLLPNPAERVRAQVI